MTTLVFSDDAPLLRGQDCTADDFTLTIAESGTASAVPDIEYVLHDITARETTTAGTVYRVTATQADGLPPVVIGNMTPSVGSLTPDGYITKAQLGGGTMTVVGAGRTGSKRASIQLDVGTAGRIGILVARQPGTNTDAVSNLVLARLSGKSPGAATQNVFSSLTTSLTLANCAAVANAGSFVADLDFSHVSFCRDNGSSAILAFPLTLVGPRHFLFARHTGCAVGRKVIWRRPDGVFVESFVAALGDLGNDLGVGLLDRDIAGIPYAKFLPQDFHSRFTYSAEMRQYVPYTPEGPCVGLILSHNPSALLASTRHAQPIGLTDDPPVMSGPDTGYQAGLTAPIDNVGQWFSMPYGGDSGSPVYMVVQEAGVQVPVLLFQLYTAGGGPSYRLYAPTIEAWFSAQGHPRTLERVSLATYPAVS